MATLEIAFWIVFAMAVTVAIIANVIRGDR
jgi:hypothetical protein